MRVTRWTKVPMNRFRGRRRTTKCSTTVKSRKTESMDSEFTDSLLILIFSLREKLFELIRTCVLVQVLNTLTTSEASSLLFLLVFGTRFPRSFVYAYFKVRPELLCNNKLFRKIIFRKFDTRVDSDRQLSHMLFDGRRCFLTKIDWPCQWSWHLCTDALESSLCGLVRILSAEDWEMLTCYFFFFAKFLLSCSLCSTCYLKPRFIINLDFQ